MVFPFIRWHQSENNLTHFNKLTQDYWPDIGEMLSYL